LRVKIVGLKHVPPIYITVSGVAIPDASLDASRVEELAGRQLANANIAAQFGKHEKPQKNTEFSIDTKNKGA
jgi:hypothetical protein